jgi:hypothetical protein
VSVAYDSIFDEKQGSEDLLLHWLASVRDDPEGFVQGAFPWGKAGTRLANARGPEPWQVRILEKVRLGLLDLSTAIQLAAASGHGVGKSALVSWLVLWGMSTFPNTRGVVTANTETQLKTKTWVELGKWFHMFIGKEFFELTATSLFAKSASRDWRFDMVPWSDRNTEAFAGLHNKGRRILVIFDEASAIPDIIWETTEGALTDSETQILWCVFGNPTRNTGRFRDCFPGMRHAKIWKTEQVDSREVSLTNKAQIKKWIETYGDDSDFVRIRVKGVFPRVGEAEFISAEIARSAALRDISDIPDNAYDPLILGVDVARFGTNESVLFFRKGRDARSIPPCIYTGLSTTQLAAKVSAAVAEFSVDAVFVDGGGVGGGVVDVLRDMHVNCFDIQFGAKPDCIGFISGVEGEKYANKRAEIWGVMRGWLAIGALPNDEELIQQLTGPMYTLNLQSAIQLERKEDMMKRGVSSPDRADALALTFSLPVQRTVHAGGQFPIQPKIEWDYDPYSPKMMGVETVSLQSEWNPY